MTSGDLSRRNPLDCQAERHKHDTRKMPSEFLTVLTGDGAPPMLSTDFGTSILVDTADLFDYNSHMSIYREV